MASLEQQLADLREQAASQYQVAKHTDGPAYEKQMTRYQVLKRQADVLEKRIEDEAKAYKKDLQLIHIAKHDMKWDDKTYRAILMRVGKKDSSKELSATARRRVLDEFKRLGWRPKRKGKRFSPKSQGQPADVARAMWITMHQIGIVDDPSEDALDKFCRRSVRIDERGNRLPEGVTFGGLRMLNRATNTQQNALLNALRGWVKRVIKQRMNNDIATIISRQHRTGETTVDAMVALLNAGKIRYWPEFLLHFGLEHQDGWKQSEE
ncbi:MAG: regulatory protein GemA [Chromatiales bacterium]|nr:regulatory protein GemA [Gammaproteobacteria bacterium]